jgi:hypothetical protein
MSGHRSTMRWLIAAAVLVVALGCTVWGAYPDTYVDDDADYQDTDGDAYFCTIQAAVAQTEPEGTVHVAGGIYPEKLRISTPLTIAGAPGSYPHICPALDSGSKYDTVITVRADNITLRGLEISNQLGVVDTGGNAGGTHIEHHAVWDESWTLGPSGLTVDDCIIHDIEHGVRSYGPNLTVTRCEMYNLRRSGVHASGPYQNQPLPMTIQGNWFHDWIDYYKEGAAVHVKYDSRVGLVSHNTISGMRMGIAYYYGGPKAVYGEPIVFSHNTIDLDYDLGLGPVETTMCISLWGTGANASAVIVRDNLFVNARWYAIYQEGATITGQISVHNNLFCNNNWYYWPDFQYPYQWFGTDVRAQAGWTGGETGFAFTANLAAQDPLFALDGIGPDAQWALQCGSPALNAATDGTHLGAWQGDVVCTIEIPIDIKPGSDVNPVNPASKGTITVAALSTESFDATDVDRETLTFGRSGDEPSLARRGSRDAPHCSIEDANEDGLPDLICHFETRACGFVVGDSMGILRGATLEGDLFEGRDAVRIVPRAKTKDEVEMASLIQQTSIRAYPNPVTSVHTAAFQVVGPLAERVDQLHVGIYDLSGHLVWEETVRGDVVLWHTDTLSGEYLANGIYLFVATVVVDGQTLVVQRGTLAVTK